MWRGGACAGLVRGCTPPDVVFSIVATLKIAALSRIQVLERGPCTWDWGSQEQKLSLTGLPVRFRRPMRLGGGKGGEGRVAKPKKVKGGPGATPAGTTLPGPPGVASAPSSGGGYPPRPTGDRRSNGENEARGGYGGGERRDSRFVPRLCSKMRKSYWGLRGLSPTQTMTLTAHWPAIVKRSHEACFRASQF
jgi:hypothetical protein